MSPPADATEQLVRKRIGVMPLLQKMAYRLDLSDALTRYIPAHANEKVSAVDTLLLLTYNLAGGRLPLYELPQWTGEFDGRLFGQSSVVPEALFNDDRFGRALDKLYLADRASLMTDMVLGVVKALNLDLSQIHNDSTSIKTCGSMPGQTRSAMRFTHGHSKDHRPDLKQIVFSRSMGSE